MQHHDDAPRIPTITAEEAMKLSWTLEHSADAKSRQRFVSGSFEDSAAG